MGAFDPHQSNGCSKKITWEEYCQKGSLFVYMYIWEGLEKNPCQHNTYLQFGKEFFLITFEIALQEAFFRHGNILKKSPQRKTCQVQCIPVYELLCITLL